MAGNTVVEAPMSFTGSARRIWGWSTNAAVQWLVLVPVISMAWMAVASWYLVFGMWVAPYRLVRRGQRQRRIETQHHAEVLAALQAVQS